MTQVGRRVRAGGREGVAALIAVGVLEY